jgi:hypothetical protein
MTEYCMQLDINCVYLYDRILHAIKKPTKTIPNNLDDSQNVEQNEARSEPEM